MLLSVAAQIVKPARSGGRRTGHWCVIFWCLALKAGRLGVDGAIHARTNDEGMAMDRPDPGLHATTCAPTQSILATGPRMGISRTRRLATLTAAAAFVLSLGACSPSGDEAPPTEMAASEATMTVVPDVVGLPLDEARDALDAAGIPILSETDIRDDKMILMASNWTVVEQSGDASGVNLGVEKPTETVTPTPTVTPEPVPVVPEPVPVVPAPVETAAAPPAAPPVAAYFANCTEARAAGVTPLHTGDPGYRSGLDRDGDGIACE